MSDCRFGVSPVNYPDPVADHDNRFNRFSRRTNPTYKIIHANEPCACNLFVHFT